MAPRVKKVKPEIVLALPEVKPEVTQWVILGLDPSLSRAGFSIMLMAHEPSENYWHRVGSVKPDDTSDDIWIRARGMGNAILSVLQEKDVVNYCKAAKTGLLLSYEAPTPGNDYLNSANIQIRSALLTSDLSMFAEIFELKTNASTMRSIMGLKATGSTNKKENQAKAWEFLPQVVYPGLDTDACDAVLFTKIGEWSVRLFRHGLGTLTVPDNFRTRFCDSTLVVKGKGRNAYTVPRGVLLNPDYWFKYTKQPRKFAIKDAREGRGSRIPRVSFDI